MTPDIKFVAKEDPLLAALPDYVKEPKNFMTIQRALLETLVCHSSHTDPAEVFACSRCRDSLMERRALMKKFGFKSSAQYMAWRKTHEEIKRRVPLDMYNRMVENT